MDWRGIDGVGYLVIHGEFCLRKGLQRGCRDIAFHLLKYWCPPASPNMTRSLMKIIVALEEKIPSVAVGACRVHT